jgi:hypothetical protein
MDSDLMQQVFHNKKDENKDKKLWVTIHS